MKKFLILLLIILLLLVVGSAAVAYRYPHVIAIAEEGFPVKVWPAKGIYVDVIGKPKQWPHKYDATARLNTEYGRKLQQLNIENETHALVAYHKGKLKYAYFKDGYTEKTQFNSFSMAKSLIGYLVLKAIDEGEIDGLDSPIGTYLIDLKDEALKKQTIERFLTMRSGLKIEKKGPPKPLAKDAKRGPDKDASNPFTLLAQMHIEGLPGIMAHLKMPEAPSDEYHYQNVNTALLGLMLTRIYKKPLNVLLSEKIWKPAGASHAHWRTYTNEGSVTPYCCLFATVEDWAKVAYFLSKNGMTMEQAQQTKTHSSTSDIELAGDDAQSPQPITPFLQSSLVLKYMVADRFETKDLREGIYGLHVRHDILDREGEAIQGPFTYFVGHGGQLVYMLPQHDLVIVRFGRKHTLLHSTAYFLWRSLNEHSGQNATGKNERHSSVRH